MIRLSYVPPPPVGASVYSILATAKRLSPDLQLAKKLFGDFGHSARPLWPIGLHKIAEALPPLLGLDAARLLREHTLVPAFLPFLAPEKQTALIESTMSLGAGMPARISGAAQCIAESQQFLRVCPECLSAGSNWWMNVHQMAGVVVCPDHPQEILHDTVVSRRILNSDSRFIDVRDAVIHSPCTALSAVGIQRAARIASGMSALLHEKVGHPGPTNFRLWLSERLRQAGFKNSGGGVDFRKASVAIFDWLGDELTFALNLESPGPKGYHWLFTTCFANRPSKHPLLASLAALSLGIDIKTALTEACSLAPQVARPVSIYYRRGISQTDALFERNVARLTRLWADPTLSLSAIGRQLGVSYSRVSSWAARLDLPFPRKGAKKIAYKSPNKPHPRFGERIVELRRRWIAALRIVPSDAGVTIHPQTMYLYRALGRYDHQWLLTHLPKRQKTRVDWNTRDAKCAALVKDAADFLHKDPRIVQATKWKILAQLPGHVRNRHESKMPKTWKALEKHVESDEEFCGRRSQQTQENV